MREFRSGGVRCGSAPLRPLGARPPIARAWPPPLGSTAERVALFPAASASGFLSPRSSWARRGSLVRPGCTAAWPMAPQRRGAPKAPEGSGAAQRRRRNSTKSVRAPREMWRKWLRAAVLGACAALAALLLWCSLGGDDGVTEVLAHRGEVLLGRFIEVPCSEDYDSHRRFEGCSPRKCGRGVTDAVITRDEAQRIRSVAEKGLSLGGSDGGHD